MDTNKIWHALVRSCLYVISNTWATFEPQFIKKLSNTKAGLKKNVVYKKACNSTTFRLCLCSLVYNLKKKIKSKLQTIEKKCIRFFVFN